MLAVAIFPIDAEPQYLHTRGREIVDANDQPVLLRGLGLGGWLVPEGYMLHIPGYGSPTSIRNLITDLIGDSATAAFYQRYRANYVNENDIALIARWGFNSIRLPFHYELLTPRDQPGVFLESGFALVDSVLAWCGRNQLYLILDMHAAPGGQNPHNISDSDGEARLWTEPANQDRTVEIWQEIARRYADEPWIGGYDLLNEPVLPAGTSNLVLRDFYRRLAQAVREVDNNHILFLEGNWFATDFSDLTPPILFGQNIVYSFHKYWNAPTKESIQGYLNLRSNWNAPLWLGESGENSNPWFHATVQLMEQNNIGWCWWTHKKIATITSPLSSPILPGYQRVLDYWNGIASRPTADFARQALFDMADNLALSRCDVHPDVLAALLDAAFGARSKPFVDHVLPGEIDAADYDLGDNGVAYFDTKASRDRFEDGEPWNSGWSYRNDGVDIEPSQDSEGAPYSVGWIEADEWLRYTVDVSTAGVYGVTLRVASPDGAGGMLLLLDGVPVTQEIRVPRTGGWYAWTSVVAPDIALPAGKHILQLHFTRAGFNINQIQFDLKQGTDVNDPGGASGRFHLWQNYPNPFTAGAGFAESLPPGGVSRFNKLASETLIRYELSEASPVRLRIFSLSGGRVRTLVSTDQAAGVHSVRWDGRDDTGRLVAAGVYVYRLDAGQYARARKLLLLR